MFICVGENQACSYKIAEGNSVDEAIKNWAYDQDKFDLEFVKYKPRVYEVIGGTSRRCSINRQITFTAG